jgi:GNAT superfamily N-acetyltransferase
MRFFEIHPHIVDEDNEPIKLRSPDDSKATEWIKKIYELYPQTFQNNHVMAWGEGESQEFAMFELTPSRSAKDAVEIYWFQAYPQRKGVGSRALKELQKYATTDGISLTLYPWDKGQVSQHSLMRMYKRNGFTTIRPKGKDMIWRPESTSETE